jgi:hypothetical protein
MSSPLPTSSPIVVVRAYEILHVRTHQAREPFVKNSSARRIEFTHRECCCVGKRSSIDTPLWLDSVSCSPSSPNSLLAHLPSFRARRCRYPGSAHWPLSSNDSRKGDGRMEAARMTGILGKKRGGKWQPSDGPACRESKFRSRFCRAKAEMRIERRSKERRTDGGMLWLTVGAQWGFTSNCMLLAKTKFGMARGVAMCQKYTTS